MLSSLGKGRRVAHPLPQPPAPVRPSIAGTARVTIYHAGESPEAVPLRRFPGFRFESPKYPVLLLAAAAAVCLLPLADAPLLDPTEGRQAEIAREMWEGGDWLVPRSGGLPYFEKPPLHYWLTALAFAAFGTHAWSARLVPVLAAGLTVLVTHGWGRRVLGPWPALFGALVLTLSPAFSLLGRTVLPDNLLLLFIVGSWAAAHLALCGPGLRWPLWLASAALCGMGILTKGPTALLLVVPPVLVLSLRNRSGRPVWRGWAAYGTLVAAVALPWYLAVALREPEFAERFLWRGNVLRFVRAYDHQQPWWFYLPVVFGGMMPWSLLWPAVGQYLGSRDPRLAAARPTGLGFLLGCAGWCLLFYSAAGCKLPHYIAPALAPLSLLTGACLDLLLRGGDLTGLRFLEHARRALPSRALAVLLVLGSGGVGVAVWMGGMTASGAAVLAVLAVGAAVAWAVLGRRAGPAWCWGTLALVAGLLIIPAARAVLVGQAARRSPAAAFQALRQRRPRGDLWVFCYGRQSPSAAFYLGRGSAVFVATSELALLVQLLGRLPEGYVIVPDGPLLEGLRQALPPSVRLEVCRPASGDAALLITHPVASCLPNTAGASPAARQATPRVSEPR
jgi:4-amino-4-deoxy-L-arabinose transferase-like glycosyltransferase